MRSIGSVGVRVEPGPVTLQSLGDGLATASVELGFYSLPPHAKNAAE